MARTCGLRAAVVLVLPVLLTFVAAPVTAEAVPGQPGELPITVTEIRAPQGFRPVYDATGEPGERHLIDGGWVVFQAYPTEQDDPPQESARLVVRDPRGVRRLVPSPASRAGDISSRGHVVGGADGFECPLAPTCERPFVRGRSGLTILPVADGWGGAVAANDQGQIAGSMVRADSTPSDTEWTAVVWDRGRALVPPDARPSQAVGIDDRGRVAMNVGRLPFDLGAAVWQPGGGVTELGTLGGDVSMATTMNERGDMAGDSWTADGATHGFLWRDGEMVDLGTLGGDTSEVYDINDRGHVVGRSLTADDVWHGFLWRDGEMTDLGTLEGLETSTPRAVNNRDQVVGVSQGPGEQQRPFLWQHGEMIDLGQPAEDAGYDSAVVSDIDDRGQIVGSATSVLPGTDELAYHVLLWTVR